VGRELLELVDDRDLHGLERRSERTARFGIGFAILVFVLTAVGVGAAVWLIVMSHLSEALN
jgi:hypothetical protein